MVPPLLTWVKAWEDQPFNIEHYLHFKYVTESILCSYDMSYHDIMSIQKLQQLRKPTNVIAHMNRNGFDFVKSKVNLY